MPTTPTNPTALINPATEFGARAARRLRDERIIWLTTVRVDGTPQPSPVWYLWDEGEEESFLIFSYPKTQKLRNIARNPTVGLHLNGDRAGNDIVILTGVARIVPDAPPVPEVPAFVRKYEEEFRTWSSPEEMGRDFSVSIRVTPTGLRGF